MIIAISQLENRPDKREHIKFNEIIGEFNPDVPVVADLYAELQGGIVKISGNIKAKVILVCDYCLEKFTKDFNLDIEEYYALDTINEDDVKEFEIKEMSFVQDLNGCDEIDITDFVYQILILNIPNRNVCGINCKGKENLQNFLKTEITDPRLQVFKNIKIQKDKE